MSTPSPNESFLKWDPAQVSNFISGLLPEEDKHLSTKFLDHNIDGSLLPHIGSDNLKELGFGVLSCRLMIKKGITNLITTHYEKNQPQSMNDPEYEVSGIKVDNCVGLQSLKLSTVLMKDMVKKVGVLMKEQQAINDGSPTSPESQVGFKKLNENFNKLKTDLIPVIRYLKESKPLPTPTLDPGPVTYMIDSPTNTITSSSGIDSIFDTANTPTSQSSTLKNSDNILLQTNRNSGAPSPTLSNRYSSGSLLSMGTGKIMPHASVKQPSLEARSVSDPNYQKSLASATASKNSLRPKLVESKSASFTPTSSASHRPVLKSHDTSGSTTIQNPATTAFQGSNEPLKQLRASSEDSCLKILQQAMKRHHIPRDDWSKYVLVICYGDKERILKLNERPVIIFKELQEHGKHPAIMLRQLATTDEDELDDIYEDSRIGDDIPGGTL